MTARHGNGIPDNTVAGGLSAPRSLRFVEPEASPRGYLRTENEGREASPVIQGWCPGALRPMLSGDGWVVRVRPRGGRLSQAQAAGIAALAATHGNGLIDLSARANVQLRGVTEAGHAPLIAGLRALGLIDASAELEARRNIVVQPFWSEGDATARIAADLAARLAAEDAPALPGKFGFAVDCGAMPVLQGTAADIRIERHDGGLVLRPDGATHGKAVTEATAAAEALALAGWFVASGGVSGGRGRMAAHLGRVALPGGFDLEVPDHAFAARPGPCPHGILLGFEFGQLQAATLAALAVLGALRVTPWRMLLLEGQAAAPDLPGLISDPASPLLHIVACTGAPGCVQALQPTRALARRLAPHVRGLVHVSGCAKGCAHPGAAPLTLTATRDGFALIRGGTAAATPLSVHSAADLLAHPEILTEKTDAPQL